MKSDRDYLEAEYRKIWPEHQKSAPPVPLLEKIALRAIAAAKADAIEGALRAVAEQRCERGTPWDLALDAAMSAIRALEPKS